VNRFGKLCFEHLIFSKVDETNTVGPLLAVLYKTGKSLAFVTNGQAVPNDISPADFNFFGSHLLPS
jgi:flagellar biosynthesis protein FlhF